MIIDVNPLINWLRLCRWLSFGRVVFILSTPLWFTLFLDGLSSEGFLVFRQSATLCISGLGLSISGIGIMDFEGESYWKKRNERYQKLIDEVRAVEND